MVYQDLTTLDDVKAWLIAASNAAPPPDTDNDLLSRLITAASEFIQRWICRPLINQNWIETRDGQGTPTGKIETTFPFAAFPVTDVQSIKILGRDIPAIPDNQVGLSAGYLWSPVDLTIRGFYVPRLKQCLRIEYTAGFEAPPPGIAQACIELVAWKYREKQHINISMQTIAGAQTQFHWGLFSQKDIGSDIEAVLMPYRSVAPIGTTRLIPG